MRNELKILIDHLEKLQDSMESIKEMNGRIHQLEKFNSYLKGMMVVGTVIAASYGYMLWEIIKKVL